MPKLIFAHTETAQPAAGFMVPYVNASRIDGQKVRLIVRSKTGVSADIILTPHEWATLIVDAAMELNEDRDAR